MNEPMMQPNLFQAIFIPLCLVMAARAFLRIGRGRVPVRVGLLSAFIWIVAAITICFPGATTYFAKRLGIRRGTDLVLYFAILAGLGISFYFYQRCRDLEILVTEVIRREALSRAKTGGIEATIEDDSASE
jgi:hypothetical protein